VVSHDESSEELEISIGCRSVNGVDRGESVDGPIGSVAVMERARSRASDFFKIPNVCSVALPLKTLTVILRSVTALRHASLTPSSPPLLRPHCRDVLPPDRTAAASPRVVAPTQQLLSAPQRASLVRGTTCAPITGGNTTAHWGTRSRTPATILLLHCNRTAGSYCAQCSARPVAKFS
jgi:hypothetical protein